MRRRNLYDKEENARTQGFQHEREGTREKKARDERARFASEHSSLIKASISLFRKSKTIEDQLDEWERRLAKEIERNPSFDEGGIVANVKRLFGGIVVPVSVVGLDFAVLSSVARLFLALAGIDNEVVVFIGKVLIPLGLVLIEAAISIMRGGKRGRPVSSYVVPSVVALLAGWTFLAWEGVLSLADIDLITLGQFIGATAIGWYIHYAVILTSPLLVEAFAFLSLAFKRFRYSKLSREFDDRQEQSLHHFTDALRLIETAQRDDEIEIEPEFHLVPADLREFVNERMGYEIIPDPSVPGPNGRVISRPARRRLHGTSGTESTQEHE